MTMAPDSSLPNGVPADSANMRPSDYPGGSSNGIPGERGSEPIAIVGFSTHFPGDATSPGGFWRMLEEGRSALSEVPQDRFNIDSFYHPDASRLDRVLVNCSQRMLDITY